MRLAATFATLVTLQACAEPSANPVAPLPPAAIAMSDTVRERALAYPDATVTDVRETPGRNAACGLLRFADKRPHVIFATSEDGEWTVSTPFLIKPDSWDMEQNRTLSDSKSNICADFGLSLPPTG